MLYDDLFDDDLVEYTIATKRGPAVLTLRPLTPDNAIYIADMLEAERQRAAKAEGEAEAGFMSATEPVTLAALEAARTREAEKLHRWCCRGLTLDGERVEDALPFLIALANHKQTAFRELVTFLTVGQAKEATPEALAGESPAG